jgi:4a-hydroxytetrahydrobiopterin dehydratase
MKLSESRITDLLQARPGWAYEDGALVRQFTFPAFPDAVAFITRLGFDAEASDHHPDLIVNYRRVTVRWSTHSEGGVTERDTAGVETADRIAARFGA